MSLSEQVVPLMAAAVRSHGDGVLAAARDVETDPAAALGRRMLQEIFGARAAGERLPAPLAVLAADPQDAEARAVLEGQVHNALHDDPGLRAAIAEALTGFYRREIEAGNTQAMTDLGDLRRWQDDLGGARAAYQQAIDAGNAHAMIDLARLLRGDLGDADGARAWFQQAIDCGDADVAAEALGDLGDLLFRRDAEGARAAYQQAIESGHPVWAPAGMVGLARLLREQGDVEGARAAYQQAIESGNADCAADASIHLGQLLHEQGDVAGAKAAYLKVIDSRNADCAPAALVELVNLL